MPELAEVERARYLFSKYALNKTIISVSTNEDLKVFVGDARSILERDLPGRTILAVKRKGKNIWLELDGEGATFAVHFGMAGSLVVNNAEPHYRRPRYIKKLGLGTQWPPNFAKIWFEFDDGTQIATTDTSRLGRIRAINGGSSPPISLLGRDALYDMPTCEEMRSELACRTAPIKAVLLDQNGIFSGLGNYLVDEILFQAKIHPAQPSYTLSVIQCQALHTSIILVVNTCVGLQADHRKYPVTWLYKYRWGRKTGKTFKMANGQITTVVHDRIGGRTTAITQVQILGDYSEIPLPKRRKATKVQNEESEDDEKPTIKRPRKKRKIEQPAVSGSDLSALSEAEVEFDLVHKSNVRNAAGDDLKAE